MFRHEIKTQMRSLRGDCELRSARVKEGMPEKEKIRKKTIKKNKRYSRCKFSHEIKTQMRSLRGDCELRSARVEGAGDEGQGLLVYH